MTELKVQDKQLVVPGEILATGMEYLPSNGTYRENDNIRAAKLGLLRLSGKVMKIIPLSGRYIPNRNDTIIGQVVDIAFSAWRLELNSAYSAMLSLKEATSDFVERGADLTQYYNLGDYMVCKITNVTSQKLVDVTMRGPGLRKLKGGRIVKVNTSKVSRIIGKQGSMVQMIKDATKCQIIVGQNGLVWISGADPHMELIANQAIKKIEEESHTSGLTERIKQYLEEATKGGSQ